MPLPDDALARLREAFGERLRLDEPLARQTSARIGGPADAFLQAQSLDDLRRAAQTAWACDVPLLLLGGGSNILIGDGGFRGLVVHNRTSQVEIVGPTVSVDSGVNTISLARRLARRGLSGFEWAVSVPGTIGGAVFGNAGAHGGDTAAVLGYAELVTPAGDETMTAADLRFEYRSSILKREPREAMILRAVMHFTPDDSDAIKARMDQYNAYRKDTQPPGATIGSMFKNPPGDYAGRLIDAAGLKGAQEGGAAISEKHANFFINLGGATAADVSALVERAREAVLQQAGVELELEVELVGEW